MDTDDVAFEVCDCEHMEYQHDFLGCAECPCSEFKLSA